MSVGKVLKTELIEFFQKRTKVFIYKTIINFEDFTGENIKEHYAN